jgi:DNA-binding MarR family transcriptional regulator
MTNKELDRCLEHMHYAFRNLVREPDRILAKYGLGRAHHRALYCIGHYAPSVGQAAKALQVSNQAFHRTMCDLITSNLVRVHTDESNRRSRRLLLTAKGRRLEQRINGIQRHVFARVARIVGRNRMAAWTTVMDQLAALRVGEGGANG